MFKWVAGLCATIYVTLMVFGAPPEGDAIAAVEQTAPTQSMVFVSQTPAPASKPEATKTVAVPAPVANQATEAAVAVIPLESTNKSTSIAPKPAPIATSQISTAPTVKASPNGVGEVWRVTGSRVNLRKAATTRASVVGQTSRGERAEVLEMLDTGWARVFIIESGIEAYMSAKFIIREG
ncbi:MAG: SH3 domain-containing protein [Pseudomonadota bacterium]